MTKRNLETMTSSSNLSQNFFSPLKKQKTMSLSFRAYMLAFKEEWDMLKKNIETFSEHEFYYRKTRQNDRKYVSYFSLLEMHNQKEIYILSYLRCLHYKPGNLLWAVATKNYKKVEDIFTYEGTTWQELLKPVGELTKETYMTNKDWLDLSKKTVLSFLAEDNKEHLFIWAKAIASCNSDVQNPLVLAASKQWSVLEKQFQYNFITSYSLLYEIKTISNASVWLPHSSWYSKGDNKSVLHFIHEKNDKYLTNLAMELIMCDFSKYIMQLCYGLNKFHPFYLAQSGMNDRLRMLFLGDRFTKAQCQEEFGLPTISHRKTELFEIIKKKNLIGLWHMLIKNASLKNMLNNISGIFFEENDQHQNTIFLTLKTDEFHEYDQIKRYYDSEFLKQFKNIFSDDILVNILNIPSSYITKFTFQIDRYKISEVNSNLYSIKISYCSDDFSEKLDSSKIEKIKETLNNYVNISSVIIDYTLTKKQTMLLVGGFFRENKKKTQSIPTVLQQLTHKYTCIQGNM